MTHSIEPRIVAREETPYYGIAAEIDMTSFATIVDRIPELIGFLAERQLPVAGAPFFRYRRIDMERTLDVEVGVPTVPAVAAVSPGAAGDAAADSDGGTGDIRPDSLPAGRYAYVLHHGSPDELESVTGELLVWAADQGLRWDMTTDGQDEHWACRLEVYLTDPREQPDSREWDTELYFKLAD